MISVQALIRLRLNARDPGGLADFFVQALGFERTLSGVRLGPTPVDIAPATGAPYPAALPPWIPLFQHFAIATGDMAAALERLAQAGGWTAITQGGPQTLPPWSGGVTAFKFRSPEGHPLELIAFPGETGRPSLRIDHSAISVADAERSVAFYQALGFHLGARSLNQGPEQERLDGLEGARVQVVALTPAARPAPHLELLAYLGDYPRGAPAAEGDVAATRLVFCADAERSVMRDPDGHRLEIEPLP